MERHWPLFGLRIVTPRLVLRLPTDVELCELADLAVAGIHPDDEMPFLTPWSRQAPDELRAGVLRWHWQQRASWTLDRWSLELAVWEGDQLVGSQSIAADGFAVRRTVTSGSWLGRAHQGRGIGTEMRRAVLHLAFAGLGAQRAETSAFVDNPASQRVTERLGYRADGTAVADREGAPTVLRRFVLDAGDREPPDDLEVTGLDACRAWCGADERRPA